MSAQEAAPQDLRPPTPLAADARERFLEANPLLRGAHDANLTYPYNGTFHPPAPRNYIPEAIEKSRYPTDLKPTMATLIDPSEENAERPKLTFAHAARAVAALCPNEDGKSMLVPHGVEGPNARTLTFLRGCGHISDHMIPGIQHNMLETYKANGFDEDPAKNKKAYKAVKRFANYTTFPLASSNDPGLAMHTEYCQKQATEMLANPKFRAHLDKVEPVNAMARIGLHGYDK